MKYLFLAICILVMNAFVQCQSIKVYFTKSVDNSVSLVTNAQFSSALEDSIVKWIDNTTANLDIAVWDNGSTEIVTALNNAYSRGVQVRYITSDNALNLALGGLNPAIPVLQRDATLTSNVMHNKFIIFDNSSVLSGSMNFGMGSMEDDYNNIIVIENATLASSYLTEFNEMWGDSGAQPNATNSKFGPDKADNTVHNFTIGSSPVELYFSPTDNTTQKIVDAINTADFTLDVALFTFTNNDIGDAVIAAKNRGVNVRVIMENESYIGSEYNGLLAAGIPVVSHEGIQFDFHHKYCVIDAAEFSSDPTVVTGSHNWTNSAEDEYDENTLIIHDMVVAGQYQEEFAERWNENTTSSNWYNQLSVYIPRFYYYFGSDYLVLNSIIFSGKKVNWTMVDLNGKLVKFGKSDSDERIYVGDIQQGYYLFILEGGGIFETHNVVFIR